MQKKQCKFAELHVLSLYYHHNLIISFFGGIWPCHFLQGGTKAIDKNVIINFRDKYAVIARFSDKKMMCLICMTKMSWYVILWNYMWWYVMKCCEMSLYVDFHSHLQFHDKTACVWDLRYRWDPLLSRKPLPRFPHFMSHFTNTNIYQHFTFNHKCYNSFYSLHI